MSQESDARRDEIVLSADKSVSRKGDVVFRPSRPWTPSVHSLLRHLEDNGFMDVPLVIGSGVDSDGSETLSYVEGEFVHPCPWSDERETAEESIEARITMHGWDSSRDAGQLLWGLTWRARAAAWILKHRSVLERELV